MKPKSQHKRTTKKRVPIIATCLIGAGLLAVVAFVSIEQKTFATEAPIDPAHAAHVAAAASQAGGQTVEAQLAEMLSRIQRLEAITQPQPEQSPALGATPMEPANPARIRPMPGMGSSPKPMQGGMAGMDMTGGGKGGTASGAPDADQLAELRAKMHRLESIFQQQSRSSSGPMPMQGGTAGMGGMGGGASPPGGEMGMMMDKMKGMMDKMMGGMGGGGMGAGNPPSGGAPGAMKSPGGMGGMGGGASPPGGEMGMMMDKMKGMMDKMMGGMSGSPMPGGPPMGGAAPGGGMGGMGGGSSGGGGMGMMDMDKMEMAGMMGGMGGKGGSSISMSSSLPGFPGASHLYHIGATGFFLDHPQHIALSTEQQSALNQIKEQSALDKASTSRSVQEAEQALWTLTAAGQPDNSQIEAKVAEIEKLKSDARLRFISAVGSAAKILNDEQRKILTGFAPPVSAAPAAAPAAAPMAGGMKDM